MYNKLKDKNDLKKYNKLNYLNDTKNNYRLKYISDSIIINNKLKNMIDSKKCNESKDITDSNNTNKSDLKISNNKLKNISDSINVNKSKDVFDSKYTKIFNEKSDLDIVKLKDKSGVTNYNKIKDRGDLKILVKANDNQDIVKLKDKSGVTNYNKIKDRGDLKILIKAKDNQGIVKLKDKSGVTNYNKIKDRGDLKILIKANDNQDIVKIKDKSGVTNYNKIKDRDLKILIKANDNQIKKDENGNHTFINSDGDTPKVSVNLRPEKYKTYDAKQQAARNAEGLKALWSKRTMVRNAQALATVDLKRIRERYTMKLRNPNRPANAAKDADKVYTKSELKNAPIDNIKKENKSNPWYSLVNEQEKSSTMPQKTHDLPQVGQEKQDFLQENTRNLTQIVKKTKASPRVTEKTYNIEKKTTNLPQIVQKTQDLFQVAQKTQHLPRVAQKSQNLHQVEQKTQDLPRTATKAKETNKKPVIRTIMTKNGPTRVYKAVTFEERRAKPAILDINIPNESSMEPNSTKSSDVNSLKSKVTVSRISVKEKCVIPKKCPRRRDKRHRRHLPSRDCSIQNIHARSPPTEVAKWAPTSITSHTKPYYDAWVDTTLTAVSKSDRLKEEKDSILRCLQKALERPDTPELFYSNYAEEQYAGRIKITHQR